jgi:hypothetical protein
VAGVASIVVVDIKKCVIVWTTLQKKNEYDKDKLLSYWKGFLNGVCDALLGEELWSMWSNVVEASIEVVET